MKIRVRCRSIAVLTAGIVCLAPAAFADSSYAQLDEILVTAQKREQNFNDVGVAISVLTAADMAAAGVRSLVDVPSLTPNVQMKNVLATPALKEQIAKLSLLPLETPSIDDMKAFVKSEIVRWGKVVEAAGIAGTE